jgi:dihydropteroate synthase
MLWKLRDRTVDLGRSGIVMGVLNTTPDSFSDGGKYVSEEAALRHASEMISEGAAILDIGGESSRPGADPVPLEEETHRVIPILQAIRSAFPKIILSVDTTKSVTAREALLAGADIINDISAATADREMVAVLKESGAGIILMHMQGTPKTMQINPTYSDVVTEIFEFLKKRTQALADEGIDPERIAIDPGYCFGKKLAHNVSLVRNLKKFKEMGRPIVVGVSKKSMIPQLLDEPRLPMEDRIWPTVAFTSILREEGAHVFRVHEVKPNLDALRMTEAILFDE